MKSRLEEYIADLKSRDLSQNTIDSYVAGVKAMFAQVDAIDDDSLLSFKERLESSDLASKTVSIRIGAVNSYLDFIEYPGIRLKNIKVQQRSYLENVISRDEYDLLKSSLLLKGDMFWYFVVRFLGGTGVRVSELREITVESVFEGQIDLIGKGDKVRRVYYPSGLDAEAKRWVESERRTSGALFMNPNTGKPMTQRGIAMGLKRAAENCGINSDVVYPHSFRHFFAKSFLAKTHDLALLADLLGHESIETTRIYLRKTSSEQKAIVDEAVDW